MDRDDRESDRERGLHWEVNDRKRKTSREMEIREHEQESRRYKDENDGAVEPKDDPEQNQLAVIADHQDAEVEPEEVDHEQNQLPLAHHQDEAVEEDHTHGGRMLYVGNLPPRMNSDDLHQLFEGMCGPVEHVRLCTDDVGNPLGYGYILFAELRDARAAQDLNGQFHINEGRKMKVWAVTNQNWLP